MSQELAVVQKQTKLKRMLSRSVRSANTMQKLLTEGDDEAGSMVATLWAVFNDSETSPKDKLLIASFFARESQLRPLVARSLGIGKGEKQQVAKTIINQTIYAEMPLEERIKRIQAEVSGVPMIGVKTIEGKVENEA